MKRINICFYTLIITLLLNSCSVERKTVYNIYDFRQYNKEGFLVTPYKYEGNNYISVGLINIIVHPGTESQSSTYGEETIIKAIENITPDQLIKLAVDKAKEMGADALVNFDIKYSYPNKYEREKYVIYGFAIKRNR